MKQELKYYVPLIMGFTIMMIALIAPPIGFVEVSAIYAGGCFLILCSAVVGLDIPEILKQVNELKRIKLEELKQQQIDNQ